MIIKIEKREFASIVLVTIGETNMESLSVRLWFSESEAVKFAALLNSAASHPTNDEFVEEMELL